MSGCPIPLSMQVLAEVAFPLWGFSCLIPTRRSPNLKDFPLAYPTAVRPGRKLTQVYVLFYQLSLEITKGLRRITAGGLA